MIGSISVSVKDSRNSYSFVLRRNITILTGESGKGKTTLFDMIADYNRYGKDIGVKVNCDRNIVAISGNNWEEQINQLHNSIIVIDEDNQFIRSTEFAEIVKNSSNYFLLITRGYLAQLPYSVDEVYEISGKKNKTFKVVYTEKEHMYDGISAKQIPFVPDVIITEDSKSGYQFFEKVAENHDIECIAASGKSNIIQVMSQYLDKNILIIADGAAFGAEISDIVSLQKMYPTKIGIFLPESFEWLILKSGLVNDPEWEKIVIPEKYVDSEKYFSWERYFTDLLVEITRDQDYKRYPVKKGKLPEYYKHERSVVQIQKNMKGISWK